MAAAAAASTQPDPASKAAAQHEGGRAGPLLLLLLPHPCLPVVCPPLPPSLRQAYSVSRKYALQFKYTINPDQGTWHTHTLSTNQHPHRQAPHECAYSFLYVRAGETAASS